MIASQRRSHPIRQYAAAIWLISWLHAPGRVDPIVRRLRRRQITHPSTERILVLDATETTPLPDPTRTQSVRGRGTIAVLLVGAFVMILNETAMNIALSTIMGDLHVTERVAQWLTTGFMLTMATVIPATGWLLQNHTTRAVFGAALGLFTSGTALCALAPTFSVLVLGRVVQATGTAMIIPLLMTTVMLLIPTERRGQVMGNVSMVISVAPAVGPTVAGFILQFLPWRCVFVLVLPLALLLLIVGLRTLRNVGTPERSPLDHASLPLAAVAFGGTVWGLSQLGAPTVPWWQPTSALILGLAALAAFLRRQSILQRTDRALLDLRTFTHPIFATAMLVVAIAMMALFGTVIMLPLLLQQALGLPPLTVGLIGLPGGILMGALGPVVGRLYDRFGPRPLILPASILVAAALVTFSTITTTTPIWLIVAAHITMSVAFAFLFTPLFTTALAAVPPPLYSHASATLGTIQQVAGAAGTTLFVTILAAQSTAAAGGRAPTPHELLTGAHWAFLAATTLWLAAIAAASFLKRP